MNSYEISGFNYSRPHSIVCSGGPRRCCLQSRSPLARAGGYAGCTPAYQRSISATSSGARVMVGTWLHIIAVRGRFIHDYATALTQWARWAQSIVESWPDTGPAAAPLGQRIIEQNARL
jgi:hypothetical protein